MTSSREPEDGRRARRRLFRRPPSPWLVLPTLLLAFGIRAGVRGVVPSPDTPWYRDAADALLASAPDYPTLLRTLDSSPPALFYLGYLHLVAFCRLAFGAHWAGAVVATQVLLVALVGLQVVRLTDRVTGLPAAAWAAFGLYALAAEIGIWPSYVLSDVLFMWLSFSLFEVVARAFLRHPRAGSWRLWVCGLALLASAVVTRPVGVVLLPWMAVAAYLWRRRDDDEGWSRPPSLARPAWGAAVLLVVGSVGYAYLLRRDATAAGATPSLLGYYARLYAEGVIITNRPLMYVRPPDSLAGYVAISGTRLAHFFNFLPGEFSAAHRIANAAFYAPAYALALVGVLAQAHAATALPPVRRTLVLGSVALIAGIALLHAHTEIDYDWRYRLPVLPHLVLLAGVGVATLRHRSRAGRAGRGAR